MNKKEEDPNLPKEEMEALKQQIKLQREGVITIKAADKGAGIMILNFKEFFLLIDFAPPPWPNNILKIK